MATDTITLEAQTHVLLFADGRSVVDPMIDEVRDASWLRRPAAGTVRATSMQCPCASACACAHACVGGGGGRGAGGAKYCFTAPSAPPGGCGNVLGMTVCPSEAGAGLPRVSAPSAAAADKPAACTTIVTVKPLNALPQADLGLGPCLCTLHPAGGGAGAGAQPPQAADAPGRPPGRGHPGWLAGRSVGRRSPKGRVCERSAVCQDLLPPPPAPAPAACLHLHPGAANS